MTDRAPQTSDSIAWRVHPAAERRGLAIIVAALIVLLSVLAGAWMGSAYWGVFAAAVLFLSLEAFFLPSAFELGPQGVTVRKPFSRVVRPWESFRRVVCDAAGVTLSPFTERKWIEPYRALRLRFRSGAAGREDPLPAQVRRFLVERCDATRVRMVGLTAAEERLWTARAAEARRAGA